MSPEKITAVVILVSVMVSAGLEIDREHLMAALRNAGLLGRALLANFVIVPIFGIVLARAFKLEEHVALGFLLMAIAPGVPFLVRAGGRKPGGSLGFAAALTFIMPALSIVTIPLMAAFSARLNAAIHVPYAQLIATLVVFQLVPLLVGYFIADRAPALAAKLKGLFTVIFFLAVIALLVMVGLQLVKAVELVYGSRAMWAILVLVLLSIGTGWILGGPQIEYRRTLSIATALRNIGTSAVLATGNFPHTLVTPTVLTYFLIQFVVSLILRVYFHRTAARAAGNVSA
jgi:bile acid:Na+ symporter, BASS family